jgi:hypothetical protein
MTTKSKIGGCCFDCQCCCCGWWTNTTPPLSRPLPPSRRGSCPGKKHACPQATHASQGCCSLLLPMPCSPRLPYPAKPSSPSSTAALRLSISTESSPLLPSLSIHLSLPRLPRAYTYLVLGLELLGQRRGHDRPPHVGRGREVSLAALAPGGRDVRAKLHPACVWWMYARRGKGWVSTGVGVEGMRSIG